MGINQSSLYDENDVIRQHSAYLKATCDDNKQVLDFLNKISNIIAAYRECLSNADEDSIDIINTIINSSTNYYKFMVDNKQILDKIEVYARSKLSKNKLHLLISSMTSLKRLSDTRTDGYKSTIQSLKSLDSHSTHINKLLSTIDVVITTYNNDLESFTTFVGIISAMQRTLNVTNTEDNIISVDIPTDIQITINVKPSVGATNLRNI